MMPEFKQQRLGEYEKLFKKLIPGVTLRESTYHGLVAQWEIRLDTHILFAANEEHAERLIISFAEQLKTRAIRELGLEPVLDAMRAEFREYQTLNIQQANRLLSQEQRIAELEEALDSIDRQLDE